MAVIEVDTRRNHARDAGTFARDWVNTKLAMKDRELQSRQEDRLEKAAVIDQVKVLAAMLDEFHPSARSAAVRLLTANLAQMGGSKEVIEWLKSNPQLKGPTIEELRAQYVVDHPDDDVSKAILAGSRTQGDTALDYEKHRLNENRAIQEALSNDLQRRYPKRAMEEFRGEGNLHPSESDIYSRSEDIAREDITGKRRIPRAAPVSDILQQDSQAPTDQPQGEGFFSKALQGMSQMKPFFGVGVPDQVSKVPTATDQGFDQRSIAASAYERLVAEGKDHASAVRGARQEVLRAANRPYMEKEMAKAFQLRKREQRQREALESEPPTYTRLQH